MSTESGDRAVVGTVCARGPTKRSEHGPSRTHVYTFEPVHAPYVCASWVCRALPKNRGSRARAIPRATPPVPHAPIRAHTVRTPGSPFRASSRRGWRRRASSAAVHQPRLQRSARGARGAGRGGTSTDMPRVLALAGRGSRPAASARPLPRHALPPRPSDSSTRRRGRGRGLDSRRRKGWRSLRPVSRGHTSPAVGAASATASPRQRSRPALT